MNRLFRLEQGEWPKLLQFGLFGFLLQMGMGIGFSAGDAAFLSNVGADRLPVIFVLTPVVMLLYTALFSFLLVRFSIGHMVDFTLAFLIAGGATLWALLNIGLSSEWEAILYYALKLYLAVWYIGLYTLFWNFTDTYFDIQDAKRLFPLFSAFCALGTATGAMFVSVFASLIPMHYFFLIWAIIVFATAPVARLLRNRWVQIAESDMAMSDGGGGTVSQLAAVARAFKTSRFAIVLTLTLFVTLLMTNLAEFQYSKVLQEGRSEAELASLLGALYAAANIFNVFVCLLVFNRLVARFGVRNVAFIQPLTYFAVFGYFFLEGGAGAALAAFFAYHGVLTSIQYNNENLLFNAVPSQVKRPLRTVIEGLCEPIASLVAGGFLLYSADYLDMRELSGLGVIIGLILIAWVVLLRQLYPAAMAMNMRLGWLNFGERRSGSGGAIADFDADARALIAATAGRSDTAAGRIAQQFSQEQTTQAALNAASDIPESFRRQRDATTVDAGTELQIARVRRLVSGIGDTEAISEILTVASELAPRDRRAVAAMLAGMGETSIPPLIRAMGDKSRPYRLRSVAARALAQLSYAQFSSQLHQLVQTELHDTERLLSTAAIVDRLIPQTASTKLLARAQREHVGASIDFALELLSLGELLPNSDLLIVSLHSANAKVRANALETIESGIDTTTFRLLRSLILQREPKVENEHVSDDQVAILQGAIAGGHTIEVAAAVDILQSVLDDAAFAERIQPLLVRDMSPLLRNVLGDYFGIERPAHSGKLQILHALGHSSRLGGATLSSLLPLTEKVHFIEPAHAACFAIEGDPPIWILRSDIEAVAARHPDLALVLLKSQDARQYAA